MTGIRDFLPGFRHFRPPFDAPIAPDQPFAVIGDIHGRDDLLTVLLAKLETEAPGLPVVFVGDYVDRGPDSATVVNHLRVLCRANPDMYVALRGSHEAMFLKFLETPAEAGPRWLFNGGDKTLASFDVDVPDDLADENNLVRARDSLADSAGPELINWMRALPLVWQSGNVAVTHAGADPSQPIEPRRGHGLLWGHRDFLRKPRQDGLWIVHGHYIVPEPAVDMGRIATDTGAYRTDCLTAAIITPGNVRFLST